MKKLLAALVCLSLTLGLLAGCGAQPEETKAAVATRVSLDSSLIRERVPSAKEFAGGTGTPEDPYRIATPGQLALMIDRIDEIETANDYHKASYLLIADLRLNDTEGWESWNVQAPKYQWYPNEQRAFSGVFDGNGHTISGLYCYGPVHESDALDTLGLGLFNTVADGEIRNLTIRESYLSGMDSSKAGMFAASGTNTQIINCVNEGIVSAPLSVACGGIVGKLSGTIKNCRNAGPVSGQGGIAGLCFGSIYSCRNEGAVRYEEGASDVGGIAGGLYGGEISTTAADCLNTGDIFSGAGKAGVGGLFGSVYAGRQLVRLEDCRNTGSVYGANETGGIVGIISSLTDAVSSVTVSHAVNEGPLNAGICVGGICSAIHAHDSGTVTLQNSANRGLLSSEPTQGSVVTGGIVGGMTLTGHAQIHVDQCVNESDIETQAAGIGGIVSLITAYTEPGKNTSIRLTDCRNDGNLSGTAYGMGGITGLVTLLEWTEGNLMEIDGCVNNGVICHRARGEASYLAGIAGNFMASAQPGTIVLRDCINGAKILYDAAGLEMPEDAEGINRSFGHGIVAGFHENGLIENCTSTADVEVLNGDERWLIPETQYKNPEAIASGSGPNG